MDWNYCKGDGNYIASAQPAGKHLHNEDHHKGAVATLDGVRMVVFHRQLLIV